eukprot:TRINITY_DN29349_c0_g1_i1.p1 TRINITY_DN29349_c0_g1~~TRINITY_DN29349_c0_g1_i1.p1  ORF type:complete len:195 (+),score=32.81 TRINITY_DN29349_c0_g1_i1:197-781(+)
MDVVHMMQSNQSHSLTDTVLQSVGFLLHDDHHDAVGLEIVRWLALIGAVALIILDNTEYRTDVLISLIVPYIFINCPGSLLGAVRGEPGRWLALIAMIWRLYVPESVLTRPLAVELPMDILIICVLAPYWLVHVRITPIGVLASLIIVGFLMYQHGKVGENYREAFTDRKRLPYTASLILMAFASILMLFWTHF